MHSYKLNVDYYNKMERLITGGTFVILSKRNQNI